MPFGTASGSTTAIIVLIAFGTILAGLGAWLWRNVTLDAGPFPEADADSPAEKRAYRYYAFEQDFFRTNAGAISASEVLRAGRWAPYKGDPLEPVVLGKQIKPGDVPGRAGEVAELLVARSKIERQIEIVRTTRLPTDARDRAALAEELKQILAGIDQRLTELQPGTDGSSNQKAGRAV